MPFHSMTTTDSIESISDGLAKSPSEVLNPPSTSPKGAGGRVELWRCVSRPLRDVTVPPGQALTARHATYDMQDGLYTSWTHYTGAVRLSHERMGQNLSSIRAQGLGVVPVFHVGLCLRRAHPELQPTCSCRSPPLHHEDVWSKAMVMELQRASVAPSNSPPYRLST